MRVISITGNKLTLELSDKEDNILFRAGLQILLDEWFGKKVIVLPIEAIKKDKKMKTMEIDDKFSNLCIETAVNQALREYIKIGEKSEK